MAIPANSTRHPVIKPATAWGGDRLPNPALVETHQLVLANLSSVNANLLALGDQAIAGSRWKNKAAAETLLGNMKEHLASLTERMGQFSQHGLEVHDSHLVNGLHLAQAALQDVRGFWPKLVPELFKDYTLGVVPPGLQAELTPEKGGWMSGEKSLAIDLTGLYAKLDALISADLSAAASKPPPPGSGSAFDAFDD